MTDAPREKYRPQLKMKYKVGDKMAYNTPLCGNGIYEAEVLGVEANNTYKVKILRIIQPSQSPIGPQNIGDIDYVFFRVVRQNSEAIENETR